MKNLSYAFSIVFAWVVFTTGAVQAQENPALAQLKFYEDRIDLEFTDGRLARLMIGLYEPTRNVHTRFKLNENICFPEILGDGCDWNLDYAQGRVGFRWIANPDPLRLGKTLDIFVKTMLSDTQFQTQSTTLSIDINSLSQPYLAHAMTHLNLKIPTMTCSDDQWIQNLPPGKTDQSFMVPVWTAETMIPNEISGKNENQIFSTLYNTQLKRTEEKTYELVYSNEFAFQGQATSTPVSATQTMYYNSNQKNCSIQIKNALVGPSPGLPGDPENFISYAPLLFPNGINKNFVRTIFGIGYLIQKLPISVIVSVL